MDATPNEISLILGNLTIIRNYLLVVLILVGIVAFINFYRSVYYIRNEIKKIKKDSFAEDLKELIEKDEIAKAKSICKQKLITHPNHSYANYYLARVYSIEHKYDKCRNLLDKLSSIEPAWFNQFIKPILSQLDEIQKKNQD
jgi:thioredoxin-like negative regulator of GroEL